MESAVLAPETQPSPETRLGLPPNFASFMPRNTAPAASATECPSRSMELGVAQTRERSRKSVRLAALTQHAVVSHLP
jgi:hypothetical protein